jgi:EmrB/QacA subfamily drug resistance transporter
MATHVEEPPPRAGAAALRGGMSRAAVIWVVLGVILTVLLSALDQTVVTIAAFPIARQLDPDNGIETMPWLITAYMLTSTATQPLYGKLADLFGPKRVYLFATALFIAGSALCGVAGSMEQLIVFRAVQGVGAGGLYGISMVILALVASPKDRARYQGLATLVIAVCTVLGPLVGGYLSGDHQLLGFDTSWRWIFYVNLPIGVIALLLILARLHAPAVRRAHSVDYLGALLVMAGTCGVLLVTTWGGVKYAWSSGTIVGLSIASVVLLAAFLWRQAKAKEAIIPLRLFRNEIARFGFPILFLVGFSLMGALVYLALYLQVVAGYSPTSAGLHMLPLVVGMLVTAVVASAVIEARDGRYKICPVVGTALSTAGLFILVFLDVHSSYAVVAAGSFLLGAGLGLLMQIVLLAVQNAVPAADLNIATTSASFFRPMGQSIGVAVFGAVLTNRVAADLRDAGVTGVHTDAASLQPQQLAQLPAAVRHTLLSAFSDSVSLVFAVATGVMALAFVLTLFLKEMRLKDVDEAEAMGAVEAEAPPAPADEPAVHN